MITPEWLIGKFEAFEKLLESNEFTELDSDNLQSFITKNAIQLREVITNYEPRCSRMADILLNRVDRWLASKSDGCGHCRGCQLAKEARERLISN